MFQKYLRFVPVLVAFSLSVSPVWPQSQGGTDAPRPDDNTLRRISKPASGLADNLLISGRVLLSNGEPALEPIPVQLSCNDQVSQQVPTDSRGYFYFRLGSQRNASIGDPSVSGQSMARIGLGGDPVDPIGGNLGTEVGPGQGNMGRFDLKGCEVRAGAMSGYSTSVIRLATRGLLDSPDIGVIVIEQISEFEGTTVSVASLKAPDNARELFESALKELSREQPDYKKVEKELRKATELYPQYSSAWNLLGKCYSAQSKDDKAIEAYWTAIESDPNFIRPYASLSLIYIIREQWSEAIVLTGKLTKLNPHVPEGQYFDGIANYYLGRLKPAQKAFERLREANEIEGFPLALLHLGIIYAVGQETDNAIREFKAYLSSMPPEKIPDWHREQIRLQLETWQSQGLVSAEVTQSVLNPGHSQ